MIYTHSITSKGQITIPKEVRERLGLTKLGRASFRIDEQGQVVLEKPTNIRDIHALLAHPSGAEPLSAKEKRIIKGLRADGR